MISTLSIKNFLSLKNVKFNMGRKIFLIGGNNSGKSSVGKAIEFLYANVIEDNIKTRTIFCIDEDMDLGTYSDIVFNHEENKPVIFRFDYRSSLEEYGAHYDGEINKITKPEEDDDDDYDPLKQIKIEAKIKELWDSDIRTILEAVSESPEFHKSLLKDKFSELDFSFKVTFGPDDNAQHLKTIEFVDNNSYASLTFKPKYEYLYIGYNYWEVECKLFDDDDLNSLFENLPARFDYIFGYDRPDFSDITRLLVPEFMHFIENDLNEEEGWKLIPEQEKKEILAAGLIQLIRFYKYFTIIIRTHFTVDYIQSSRHIPGLNYLIKNDRLPKVKDYQDLNIFLPKEQAEILASGEETNEYTSLITEPEHMVWVDVFSELQELKLAKYCYLKKDNRTGEIRIVNMEGIDHNILHAGSALLSILPILLKFYFYEWVVFRNYYLSIAEPELHLNEAKQAKLASVFTSNDQLLIVETHSEAMIRKVQLLISQKEIKKEDITFLHFKKIKGETRIKQLDINSKGIFETKLPADFFDTATLAGKKLTRHSMN